MDWVDPEMTMRPAMLSELAAEHGLTLRGPDREIVTIAPLNTRSTRTDALLTFISDPALIEEMDAKAIGACVAPESLADRLGERSVLTTNGDATEAFYSLYIATAEAGRWETLESRRGENVEIAATATVHDGVELGDGCVIMDQAVVMPNTRIGKRVTVKPHATIGGEGFEVRTIAGRTKMVPHVGGVWIGDDVHIGSQTCVDRGQFGGFTVIGEETRIDNLVHVGHSAWLGPRGIVAASTEIGTIVAEEGFWLGPSCSLLQGARLGHHSYAGIGSVIVGDLTPHALAYGVPARQHGWMCACRKKLEFDGERASCAHCGRSYELRGEAIAEVK